MLVLRLVEIFGPSTSEDSVLSIKTSILRYPKRLISKPNPDVHKIPKLLEMMSKLVYKYMFVL